MTTAAPRRAPCGGEGLEPRLRVSIAMAAYEGERFIAEQLESLASQTRLPDELVVSDDCSTDGTLGIVERFSKRARFSVRVVTGTRNVGLTQNFERSIAACTGDVIFPCDQDDVWMPQKVSKMTDALARYPSAGVVVSNSQVVGEDLRPTGRELYTHGFPRYRAALP